MMPMSYPPMDKATVAGMISLSISESRHCPWGCHCPGGNHLLAWHHLGDDWELSVFECATCNRFFTVYSHAEYGNDWSGFDAHEVHPGYPPGVGVQPGVYLSPDGLPLSETGPQVGQP